MTEVKIFIFKFYTDTSIYPHTHTSLTPTYTQISPLHTHPSPLHTHTPHPYTHTHTHRALHTPLTPIKSLWTSQGNLRSGEWSPRALTGQKLGQVQPELTVNPLACGAPREYRGPRELRSASASHQGLTSTTSLLIIVISKCFSLNIWRFGTIKSSILL